MRQVNVEIVVVPDDVTRSDAQAFPSEFDTNRVSNPTARTTRAKPKSRSWPIMSRRRRAIRISLPCVCFERR
jgi:hypothetical protein